MQQIFQVNDTEQFSSFTGRDLLGLLFKHKTVILSTFLLVTLLVGVSLFMLPATYTSTGKVLVNTEQQGNPSFFSGVAAYEEQQQSDPVNRKMETEMQLVEARPIAEEVVRTLNLGFWDIYHKPLVHFLAPVSEIYDVVVAKLFGMKPDPKKYGFEDTVSEFLDSFTVGPVRSKSAETTSNVIQITMKAPDPVLAQRMLQTLMELYSGHDVRINREAGERAYKIVEEQTEQANEYLAKAQTELQSLLANRSGEGPNSIVLTAARDNETIGLLKEEILSKQMELLEIEEAYDTRSDRYRRLQVAIDSLMTRLNAEQSLYAESDVRLATLEREVRSAETVYLDLKKRLSQIGLYLDMNSRQLGNRIIVEPAIEPRESNFKLSLFLGALGSVAGLVLGLGIAGFREYMDHTVKSSEEVRRLLDIEVLGTVNLIEGKRSGPVGHPFEDELPATLASPFQKIVIRLLGRLEWSRKGSAAGKTIYVTSAKEGEGKSFVSSRLASTAASISDKRVLLIDADFENPSRQENCGDSAKGLSDSLIARDWSDIPFRATSYPNLQVMPIGTRPASGLLFQQHAINELLEVLKRHYDLIIVDAAPLTKSGANGMAAAADCICMVVDSNTTKWQALKYAISELGGERSRVVAIINKKRQYIPAFIYNRI